MPTPYLSVKANMSPISGTRILVWGNSCSGKSSLADHLARHLSYRFVELDALNWLPNWVGLNATDPDRLVELFKEATEGDAWVVAGSYSHLSEAAFYDRLTTVIWLDLPRRTLVYRCLRRSWLRSYRKTLLWGTNTERFIDQLKIWRKEDSLLWWVWTQAERKKREGEQRCAEGIWKDMNVVKLHSAKEINRWLESQALPPLINPELD